MIKFNGVDKIIIYLSKPYNNGAYGKCMDIIIIKNGHDIYNGFSAYQKISDYKKDNPKFCKKNVKIYRMNSSWKFNCSERFRRNFKRNREQ